MRPIATNYAKSGKRFASAHSRGLRPIPVQQTRQRVSLPQRIRAGCDTFAVATPSCLSSLPQRIRAGCDASDIADYILSELCHSAFARVATALAAGCRLRYVLCHSAFARVATPPLSVLHCLRASLPQRIRAGCDAQKQKVALHSAALPQRIRAGCDHHGGITRFRPDCFATAHSRGLRRLFIVCVVGIVLSLPQRIRAGCDLCSRYPCRRCRRLCHSAFARVATAEKQCSALRICCEKVDSFSSVGESGLALTIFPFSFAAKATYVAINDSFGRAIDRFFGANRTGISVNYDFAEHPCL